MRSPSGLPRRLSPNELPNAAWFNRLLDWLVANRLQSTPSVRVSALRGGGGVGAYVARGGGAGVPAPEKLVTHRSTIGGTPTLNGRTDWTRTSAEIVAGTMPAGFGEDDLTNCLVTLPASGTYIDGANKKFKASYYDVEYDEFGRVASNSDLFTIDMHTGDDC